MADKQIISASLVQRYDTADNWKNSSIVSQKGEIAIVGIVDPGTENIRELKIKIGDGRPWNQIPNRPFGNIGGIILNGNAFEIIDNTATLNNFVAKKAEELTDPDSISVGFATQSNQLISEGAAVNRGSSTQPVYFEDGRPVECASYESAIVGTAKKLWSGSVGVIIENDEERGYVLKFSPYNLKIATGTTNSDSTVITFSPSQNNSPLTVEFGSVLEFRDVNGSGFVLANGTVFPMVSGSLDLGMSSSPWRNLYVGNVFASGDVIAGHTSDRRLKENIETIEPEEADKVLKALNPVSFDWNAEEERLTEGKRHGRARSFLADEFLKVIPNAGQKVYDEKYDAIYIEQVIPYLVAGYQKQQQEIEDLRKELANLKNSR